MATTPGGVHSNIRLERGAMFFDRADGAWLWATDGTRYLDYLLGQGPAFLGHARAEIIDAAAAAARRGIACGAQQPIEVEASERILAALPWAERVRIGSTSTESVQAALRIARAATGRGRCVRFVGHYHGWLDNVLLREKDAPLSPGQATGSVEEYVLVEWNDLGALAAVLTELAGTVAAVLMEPIMLNTGGILPLPGYLAGVRRLCDQHGIILIFDETITGFRVSAGGAAELYGVAPDLAVYGKALAGGWPVSAVVGSAALFDPIARGVVHAGTFNANAPACAAIVAALDVAATIDAHGLVEAHGTALMRGIEEIGARHGEPLRVRGLPAAFYVSFDDGAEQHDAGAVRRRDAIRYGELVDQLLRLGIWVAGRGVWYVSAAHGDAELEIALTAVETAVSGLATG